MSIRQMGAELFHADGRIDGRTEWSSDRHDEVNFFAFRNFANALEKVW